MRIPTHQTYNLSNDYEMLIALLEKGHEIACFVDYVTLFANGERYLSRDIAKADCGQSTLSHKRIYQAGVRGIGYLYGFGKDDFIAQCKESNLAFIIQQDNL